jgi:NADH dehydrogenase FAD-containing subunit
MLNQSKKIVVLGAGYAGLLAALRLSRQNSKQATVTLVNASPVFVERVRLHQQAAAQLSVQHSLETLLANSGVTFVQGLVTSLEPSQHKVTVAEGGLEQILSYDILVYALGSMVDRDSVAGVREHAYVLSSEQSGALHQKLLAAPTNARLVICGGGLTGIEAATELAETYPHLQVDLITTGEFPVNFSPAGRAHIKHVFERLGIQVHDQTSVTGLDASEVSTTQGKFAYDVAVWAGSFAVPGLARAAGLTTNLQGQIVVDQYLQAQTDPDIYAVGDAAHLDQFQPALRMACATALPMALQVCSNITARLKSQSQQPFKFKYLLRCVSLGRHDGLVQFVHSDDSPTSRIWSGRLGAFVKEQLCRYAFRTATQQGLIFGKSNRSVRVSQPVTHV